jgi:hypothetical protein
MTGADVSPTMVAAPDVTADAVDDSVVRWQGESHGRLRTAFRHVVAATFLTVGVALLAAVALVVAVGVVEGATDSLVLLVVMLLVGGPFSLVYLVAIRREASLSDLLPYELNLTPRYVLAGVPVAVALLATVAWFPPLLYGYLLAMPFVWGAIAARDSGGELDAEAGTLTLDTGTAASAYDGPVDVRTLRSHAAWRVGGYRLVRLKYAASLAFSKPKLLLVPAADYPAVDAALSAVERRDYGVEVSEVSTGAKAFLAGFGLLFLAVAAGLVVFLGDADSRVLIPAVAMGAFGGLFVLLAWVS